MARKPSDLTITDQFCGAGGSSIGAAAHGFRLRLAMNHWSVAIATHNTNFPNADHVCADISATDPRRYPSTNVLLTSPECTNHSIAKSRPKGQPSQPSLFDRRQEEERSRATMWDVPRFAEVHGYDAIVVENVVEAAKWSGFRAWWIAMEDLGYRGEAVFLNSMVADGEVPQSRDRMYVVWTDRRMPAPDLEFRPAVVVPSLRACRRGLPGVEAAHQRLARHPRALGQVPLPVHLPLPRLPRGSPPPRRSRLDRHRLDPARDPHRRPGPQTRHPRPGRPRARQVRPPRPARHPPRPLRRPHQRPLPGDAAHADAHRPPGQGTGLGMEAVRRHPPRRRIPRRPTTRRRRPVHGDGQREPPPARPRAPRPPRRGRAFVPGHGRGFAQSSP